KADSAEPAHRRSPNVRDERPSTTNDRTRPAADESCAALDREEELPMRRPGYSAAAAPADGPPRSKSHSYAKRRTACSALIASGSGSNGAASRRIVSAA